MFSVALCKLWKRLNLIINDFPMIKKLDSHFYLPASVENKSSFVSILNKMYEEYTKIYFVLN